jgi:hypothetical protein
LAAQAAAAAPEKKNKREPKVRATPPGSPRARRSVFFYCNLGFDALVWRQVSGRGAPFVKGRATRWRSWAFDVLTAGWQQQQQGGEEGEEGHTKHG